jgi:hypothetical protein
MGLYGGHGGIYGDALEPRKKLRRPPANPGQIRGGHGQGVARRKKKALDPGPQPGRRLLQIGLYLRKGAHTVRRPLFIDHAKAAFIMGATHSSLDQKAVRL